MIATGAAGTVEVLLSTYNGSRHLEAQLVSLGDQTYPDIALSIRDDGSTDDTVRLLHTETKAFTNVRLEVGENVGAAASFFSLLERVAPTTRFVAFCDQDDIWAADKLEVAVRSLQSLSEPALYCSAINLVTDDLRVIKVHRRCTRGTSFANALVENVATGCTMVLNRAAVDLVNAHKPRAALMHDAWCYLVLSALGQVIYDPVPRVYYRVHPANAIGVDPSPFGEWRRRARNHWRHGADRALTAQASEFRALYGAWLGPEVSSQLDDFLDSTKTLTGRARYSLIGAAHRQRLIDDAVFRVLYLLRRV